MIKHLLRIHGDNVLECENALKLLTTSLNCKSTKIISGPAYAPIYELVSDKEENFTIQLFPGYGRWNFPLVEHVASLGGTLREAPDAIITKVEIQDGNYYEAPILALEFSGALPAGNNAWQRAGRALALAYAGIPYLYFAELGGQELDSTRTIKAARFPNPLVPFAFAVLGANSGSISIPIYLPSPSSDEKVIQIFKDCFGTQESIEIVRAILLSTDLKDVLNRIENKILKTLETLSNQRKRTGILKSTEWKVLYSKKSGTEKINWLIKKAMLWKKKTSIATLTPSFHRLLKVTVKSGAVAIGSREMPICVLPANKRAIFAKEIVKIYKKRANVKFIQWLSKSDRHLICAWVAGFKPRGDDSRPDRGLVPLARMIFGIENVDLLTVIYGPAKSSTWSMLQKDMIKLAATNGLWEAIINLSNGILVDSSTSKKLETNSFLVPNRLKTFGSKLLPGARDVPIFGEHDVDSVLHLLFSNAINYHIYESLCNPPGGDWSGINVFNKETNSEFRWTSLPRVSGISTKRPDHIIQFIEDNILLSMESKDLSVKLEKNIGPRLTKYIEMLSTSKPVSFRQYGKNDWLRFNGDLPKKLTVLSGVSFRYEDEKKLKKVLKESKSDIVLGIEFNDKTRMSIIHLITSDRGSILIPVIQQLIDRLNNIITLALH